MLWLQRISLNLNKIFKRQKEVVQTKQRKHTFTHVNTTFGEKGMSQAKVSVFKWFETDGLIS